MSATNNIKCFTLGNSIPTPLILVKVFTAFTLLVLPYFIFSQQQILNESFNIEWHDVGAPGFSGQDSGIPFFDEAGFTGGDFPLPVFSKRIEVPGPGSVAVNVNVRNFVRPSFTVNENLRTAVSEEVVVSAVVEKERNRYFANIFFRPIFRNSGGEIQLTSEFTLSAVFSPSSDPVTTGRSTFKDHSELADGSIFKIAIDKGGIHQIDAAFIRDELGLNPAEIQVDRIRILGNRGGMLPKLVGAERVDDVEEIPSRFIGTGSTLAQGGKLLFYAEGPQNWTYNNVDDSFDKPKNIYDHYNYYFIKIGAEDRKEIPAAQTISNIEQFFDSYEFLQRYEVDRVNVMGANPGFYGGGRRWFGDNLSNIRSKDYSQEFDLDGFIPGTELEVNVEFAIRSNGASNTRLRVGQENFNRTVSAVSSITSSQSGFANLGVITGKRTVGNDLLSMFFEITSTGSISESWMDFLQIRGFKPLEYSGQPLTFRNSQSLDYNVAGFDLRNSTTQGIDVWDVTDPHSVSRMPLQIQGQSTRFGFTSSTLRQFIAFNPEGNFPQPRFIEEVPNQNLHAISSAELLIVYHPDFEQAALELADHRRSFSGLEVVAVPVNQVFNEFGGGSADPTAIRDFARMLYLRTDDFRYLLLFGDGSYDYKNLMPDLPDQNFIPVYQTAQSLNALSSYPSDDFFGLLDEDEGANLIGAIDIAVGRLPARTAAEASTLVNKIISYDTQTEFIGDWRLNLAFIADNGDNNLHLNQTRGLVATIKEDYPEYNIQKVYFDAFERVSTPGGNRFPEAKNSLNRIMNRGPLVINYLGHGGPAGWAQERVLQIPDINSWTNSQSLSLMITATCSFANYDDPAITSAGEHVVLNPNGGSFGLLTTTRLVFAFANERLNKEVLNRLFEKDENGENASIGTVMMVAKNNSRSEDTENVRKFTLLGDPSQKLAIAQYSVATTSINGRSIESTGTDTLKALQTVVIEGEIRGPLDRVVSDFNGVLDFTLFDKPATQSTLGQGSTSHQTEFKIQNNVLFKGSATVNQGRFQIEFIVPLDINYQLGFGKASYFAYSNDMRTAAGAYQNILIGGSSDDIPEDRDGPEIMLYMNDESFVYGGITDANPSLLVLLEDESGINVASNSIGRELSAWLNGDINNKIVLNDYYQAEKDNFRRGRVTYPFYNLEDGRYEINVVAWDILNNKSEAMLEFVVMSDQNAVIERMLNYPNPFMNHTEFQFEHNLPPGQLDVRISIFSLSGRLVKDIHTSVMTDGYRVTGIEWNGMDDYGDRLANGVYLYRVNVRSDHKDLNNKTAESKFERLVILR
ncbi:MAG: hypothetical protein EA409_07230 [Saprospirales bacterium]|nr:MAG: hypothetical protein EA409_07230 [Saprospirales bacterium]